MKADTLESPKMAAAISAVFGYIRAQEDAAAMLAMSAEAPAAEPRVEPCSTAVPVKFWGISARQDMMGMRNLMQMRTFRGKTG